MTEDLVEIPHVPLPTQTLVREAGRGQLLWIDGLLPLGIGTRINLDNIPVHPQVPLDPERFPSGRADAVVVKAGIWGTLDAMRCLVLEVELVPAGEEGTWMVQE